MNIKERVIKNWITSLIGVVLMGFVVYRFMRNIDEIEGWYRLTVYGIGILIGFLLFRAKDTWLINQAQGIANSVKPKKKSQKG